MPQKEIAKKHHFVPEFYLKRWACSDRQLVEFQRHHGGLVKAKRKFPSETGFVKFGYALQGFPPETASVLEETFFKPVDTRASEALAKMEKGVSRFTDAERVAWTQSLLSLVHRHPERIEQLRQMFDTITFQISKAEQRRWRRERRPEDPKMLIEAMRSDQEKNADRWQRRGLGLMTSAISSTLVGTHIANMQWATLVLPPNAPALLTSDMPVHWFQPLTNDGCHILLPIGPKRIFFAVNNQETAVFLRSRPPIQMVSFLNEQAVRRAKSFVYGLSDARLSYVQERMGVDPLPNSSDLAYEAPTPKRLKEMRRNAMWRDKRIT